MSSENEHIPVLLSEVISGLNIRDGGIYVDLTLGRAGHSKEILKRIPHGHLYGFDQDPEALSRSKEVLEKAAVIGRLSTPTLPRRRKNWKAWG